MKLYLAIILICLNYGCFSQIINFTDLGLKQHLINELCVDTNFNGSGDLDVDLNNDNEIQFSEAASVLTLRLIGNDYPFSSIEDLNQFHNLSYLRLLSCDSISEFSNLISDSIKSLVIGQCQTLKIIDISGLTGLSDVLRVEDMDTLDYVNTQNGITPQLYSFFYTDHIRYACIDSNSIEYNEVVWKMVSGLPTTDNCSVLSTDIQTQSSSSFEIFPNPTNDIFEISYNHPFDKINIYDINGVSLKNISIIGNKIDITNLSTGVYFLVLDAGGKVTFKKIVKT